MSKFVPIHTRCVIAAQSATAGHLLYRLHFWMPKATVEHHGLKFVANSAKQWRSQTSHTRDQHRRAIAQLRKLGLVETEQHLFGGKNITHARITEAGYAAIANAQPAAAKSAPLVESKCADLETGGNAQLYIQGGTSLEVHNGETTAPFANAHNAIPLARNNNKKLPGKVEEKKGKIENLTNEIAVPDQPASDCEEPSSTLSAKEAAALWGKLVALQFDVHVPPPTSKELGQFKHVIASCPEGLARKVVETCIANWGQFTQHAKYSSAAFPIPAEPRIGFLAKYVADAVNFTLGALKSAQAEKTALSKQGPPVVGISFISRLVLRPAAVWDRYGPSSPGRASSRRM